MKKNSIADQLSIYRTLIFNSKDPDVLKALDKVGIDIPYIDVGITIFNEAEFMVRQMSESHQEQDLTYDDFHVTKAKMTLWFNQRLKMVKTLSRNDKDLQDRLKLKTGRVDAIEKWIERGIELYTLLAKEPNFLTKLAARKVTAEVLEAEKAAFENLKTLRNKVAANKGNAQESTRLRNEKLDELNDYCTELKAMAEIAIDGKSQLLEKLGLAVK